MNPVKGYYTGVGSRDTPLEILTLFETLAASLAKRGWVLRSGGAGGADTAFETGALKAKSPAPIEIYLPSASFNGRHSNGFSYLNFNESRFSERALEMASTIHPAWSRLAPFVKRLHARNIFQVLGKDLQTPSDRLICYAPITPQGNVKGGTRTAVVLAERYQIPVLNVADPEALNKLRTHIASLND